MLVALGRLGGILAIVMLTGFLLRKLVFFAGLLAFLFKASVLIAFLVVLGFIACAIFRDRFSAE